MSDHQGNHRELFEQVHQLVTARINDEMTPEQFTRLDALLSDSVVARRLYVRYIYETLALPSLLGTADSPTIDVSVGTVDVPVGTAVEHPVGAAV